MKVMEVISGVGVNGAVVHCVLLARELAKRGNYVMLVCRHDAWAGRQLRDTPNIEVVESDMSRWPPAELKRVAALANERGVEVIHTHMTRAHNFGVFLQRAAGIPCVATAHSHKIHPHWWFAGHIIAVSDVTRRYHLKRNHTSPGKIDTVHGFIDADRFTSVPQSARAEVRAELGLSEETPLAGCIGDFLPRKGQLYLVRAMPRILERLPNFKLALAGSICTESYHKAVVEEAAKLGVTESILWLGYRQDVPRLLQALDVYVLASLDEMFPVAVLEAMAAGKAVAATAVGGTPECLAEPGALRLMPPADPQAIAEALLEILTNEEVRKNYEQTGRRTVEGYFTVEKLAPRIEEVFARVTARKKGEKNAHR